ncbi:MAG: FAD-binding oxidoreductase, partial [Anaerolineae bacterium]|nr:FAD-binding oxidoreductase [Anaerolineae bacterium]
PSKPPRDTAFADVVAAVPPSRLPDHALVTIDPADRVRHARGQSLPDWVALRSGRIPVFPDGVAYPLADSDVQALIRFAAETGTRLIPYGGGTSVAGHINPLPGDAPVLIVDLGRMNTLRRFDEISGMATFGAGVSGPDLEAQLRARGFTLGHYPQSFELSTLGGWIATRSSGQQSLHYGRIEQLFCGGRLESPAGRLDLPCFPASAAGPDLREWVLGSEGRLGIITEATVRVSRLPEREDFRGIFFPTFEQGMAAVRAMAQARLPLSMLRLSTAIETQTTLTLAGHERVIGLLERYLTLRGAGDDKCLLILGATGRASMVKATIKAARGIAGDHGGVHIGRIFGNQWLKSRFRTPYLRNTLWEMGYAIDTLETATPWHNVPTMLEAIESALRSALADTGERIHVFTHLSHVYPLGSSVYTTYLFRAASNPDETLARWQALKTAASTAIVEHGGTISHQHGVGTDHAPYLAAEKGLLGISALKAVCQHFDPAGIMNPGKLLAGED